MPFPNDNFVKLTPLALTTTASNRISWRRQFDHLLANGFTLVENGDGLSAFSNSVVVITSDGTGANGVNAGAWISLADPDGVEQILLEFVADGGSGPAFGYDVSPLAGFTGGAAAVLPTATDQGTVSSQNFAGFVNFAATNHVSWGFVETTAPYRFGFFVNRDDAGGGSNFARTRPHYGFWRDTMGSYDFPEAVNPTDNIYAHGVTQNAFENSAGIAWEIFSYLDASAPATSANFDLLIRIGGYVPSGAFTAVPWDLLDGGGVTAQSLHLRRSAVTQRVLPALTMMRYKGNLETSFGCRVYEIPVSMGGEVDNFGHAVGFNNIVVPWSPPSPWINLADDPTSTTGVSATRLYPVTTIIGGSGIVVPDPPAAVTGQISNFLEEAILNYIRGTTPTAPGTVYMSLHTADPGEDGLTAEIVGNGYARQVITFAAPSGGIIVNDTIAAFVASGGDWGTITHFGIWDSLSAGNHLMRGTLSTTDLIEDGDTQRAESGTTFLTVG